MSSQNISLKAKIICDLHKVFTTEFEIGDMKLTQSLMNVIINHHGLKFLEPKEIDTCFFLLDVSDIDTSFYDAVYCQQCMDLAYFAIHCEAYIDFTAAICKENEAKYGAYSMYHIVLINKSKNVPEYFKIPTYHF